MHRLVVFFFGLSVVCAQAEDAPSSVMFWRYSVSGSCQEQGMPKYSFPTQIVLQERSRDNKACLLYTSPSPRDKRLSRMPSSA